MCGVCRKYISITWDVFSSSALEWNSDFMAYEATAIHLMLLGKFYERIVRHFLYPFASPCLSCSLSWSDDRFLQSPKK